MEGGGSLQPELFHLYHLDLDTHPCPTGVARHDQTASFPRSSDYRQHWESGMLASLTAAGEVPLGERLFGVIGRLSLRAVARRTGYQSKRDLHKGMLEV